MEASHLHEFRMPRVGVSQTRVVLAGQELVKYSVRCDVEGCWFAGGSFPAEAQAQAYLDDHKAGRNSYSIPSCPAPPRRESLPSGLKYIEKLWREMDDVVEALATSQPYRDMTDEQLKGYAKAIAFSIVMLDGPFFADILTVSKHARDRRKMRLGEMEYASTPSRFSDTAKVQQVQQLHNAGPVPKPAKVVPENTRKGIKAGMNSGLFGAAELAETFSLTVEEVLAIANA